MKVRAVKLIGNKSYTLRPTNPNDERITNRTGEIRFVELVMEIIINDRLLPNEIIIYTHGPTPSINHLYAPVGRVPPPETENRN